jgi:hypothetical protein
MQQYAALHPGWSPMDSTYKAPPQQTTMFSNGINPYAENPQVGSAGANPNANWFAANGGSGGAGNNTNWTHSNPTSTTSNNSSNSNATSNTDSNGMNTNSNAGNLGGSGQASSTYNPGLNDNNYMGGVAGSTGWNTANSGTGLSFNGTNNPYQTGLANANNTAANNQNQVNKDSLTYAQQQKKNLNFIS